MEFWRKKKAEAVEAEQVEAAGSEKPDRRSTALATRPIPEDALIVIPLRNAVLFPGVISPITIGRASSVAAASEASRSSLKVGFVLQRDPKTNDVGPKDLYRVGTSAVIHKMIKVPDGTLRILVQGTRRIELNEPVQNDPYLVGEFVELPDELEEAPEVEALTRNVQNLFGRVIGLVHYPGPIRCHQHSGALPAQSGLERHV